MAPKSPRKTRPKMTIPIGKRPIAKVLSSTKVGIDMVGGGVNVGNRAEVPSAGKAAARVGSMVGVVIGVGSGGGSTMGKAPEDEDRDT